MSDRWRNPFATYTGGNPVMPARRVAPDPTAPAPMPAHFVPLATTKEALAAHGNDQAAMIRKRDAMSAVTDELARIMRSPVINRADIVSYIGGMHRKGILSPSEATVLLHLLPQDQQGMRLWARRMFSVATNTAIHAHAAYPTELFPGGGTDGG